MILNIKSEEKFYKLLHSGWILDSTAVTLNQCCSKIKAAFGTGIIFKGSLPLEVKFEHLCTHIESDKQQ